jgi:hypothetical protein
MDSVANLSQKERAELFEQTASRRGFHPAIAEKDFWVCWVLKKLFSCDQLAPHLVFKGGTSLSKAHGLIERFSEDIDLVLNWELLGYGKTGSDPWQEISSNTQLDKFNREFNRRAAAYIKDELCPAVAALLQDCPGVQVAIAETDPQVVNIHYPAAFSLDALRPEVKLEIGPLASWVPSAHYEIIPFAAQEFPQVFQVPTCTVTAITAARTFWEKATILHQQAHRTNEIPPGYSRHYYDLFQLSASDNKAIALNDPEMLSDVVKFKKRFYRSTWASYETAWPPTFRLTPDERLQAQLQSDYRAMRPMFFSVPPSWNAIMEKLSILEREINQLPWSIVDR